MPGWVSTPSAPRASPSTPRSAYPSPWPICKRRDVVGAGRAWYPRPPNGRDDQFGEEVGMRTGGWIVVGALVALAACDKGGSSGGSGEKCEQDGDCKNGFLCEAKTCVP